jgi:hypothetical protein
MCGLFVFSTNSTNYTNLSKRERGREWGRESGCVGGGERDQDFGQARSRAEENLKA